MAQVIDSLIVTLGLDPKNFTTGQKQAANSLLGFRKSVSDASSDIGGELLSLSKKFTAFFLGFEGLKGAIDLLKETADQFKSLDISANVLGTSVRQLRTWSEASRLAGGSAEDAQTYILGMQESMANLKLQGTYDPRFSAFARIGLSPLAANLNDPTAFLRSIMQALPNAPGQYGATRAGRAVFGMSQLGLPESLAWLLSDRNAFNRWVGQAQIDNHGVTDKQGQAALELTNRMISLSTRVQNVAAESFPLLESGADQVTSAFAKLIDVLHEIMNSPFVKWIESVLRPEAHAATAAKALARRPGAPAWLKHGVSINPLPGIEKAENFLVGTSRFAGAAVHSVGSAVTGAEQYGAGLIDAIKSFFAGGQGAPSAAHGNAAPGAAAGSTQIAIGNITINTQATDAAGIASDLQGAIQRKFWAAQADNGVTQ